MDKLLAPSPSVRQHPMTQLVALALSFSDDLLWLGLSHLGFNLPWLQWISPLFMVLTLELWLMRLLPSRIAFPFKLA